MNDETLVATGLHCFLSDCDVDKDWTVDVVGLACWGSAAVDRGTKWICLMKRQASEERGVKVKRRDGDLPLVAAGRPTGSRLLCGRVGWRWVFGSAWPLLSGTLTELPTADCHRTNHPPVWQCKNRLKPELDLHSQPNDSLVERK